MYNCKDVSTQKKVVSLSVVERKTHATERVCVRPFPVQCAQHPPSVTVGEVTIVNSISEFPDTTTGDIETRDGVMGETEILTFVRVVITLYLDEW